MAFTIHYTRGDRVGYDSYDDSHAIVIKEWGLIEVTKDSQQVQLYSPNYWTYVTPGEKQTAAPARIR